MNGRLEKELDFKDKISKRLKTLPNIFSDFYNWLTSRDLSYNTINNYLRHCEEFMDFTLGENKNDLFYLNITDSDIESYMNHIRYKTVNGKLIELGDEIRSAKWSSLNKFFKFLILKKYIDKNPMETTERPRNRTEHKIVFLTPDEINSVFEKISEIGRPMTKKRDMCIVALALSTGLRVSAITNINVEDIDFQQNFIKVIEKGRKIREISFANNFKNLLMLWINDRNLYFSKEKTGPLFLSQLKERISVDSVEDLVKKYTLHLDKKITPHKLRSSVAMNLLDAGVDVLTISSLLGHEQVTTTQRYVEAYKENKEHATDILDKLI